MARRFIVKDATGTVLADEDVQFSRRFAIGQTIIENSLKYRVVDDQLTDEAHTLTVEPCTSKSCANCGGSIGGDGVAWPCCICESVGMKPRAHERTDDSGVAPHPGAPGTQDTKPTTRT